MLQIVVFKTKGLDMLASFRVTTGTSSTTAIKSIEFARRSRLVHTDSVQSWYNIKWLVGCITVHNFGPNFQCRTLLQNPESPVQFQRVLFEMIFLCNAQIIFLVANF